MVSRVRLSSLGMKTCLNKQIHAAGVTVRIWKTILGNNILQMLSAISLGGQNIFQPHLHLQFLNLAKFVKCIQTLTDTLLILQICFNAYRKSPIVALCFNGSQVYKFRTTLKC